MHAGVQTVMHADEKDMAVEYDQKEEEEQEEEEEEEFIERPICAAWSFDSLSVLKRGGSRRERDNSSNSNNTSPSGGDGAYKRRRLSSGADSIDTAGTTAAAAAVSDIAASTVDAERSLARVSVSVSACLVRLSLPHIHSH
jgi:hypothetical protein